MLFIRLIVSFGLLILGLIGLRWYIKESLDKGPFVGTEREVRFVAGTFMTLACIPAAFGVLLY